MRFREDPEGILQSPKLFGEKKQRKERFYRVERRKVDGKRERKRIKLAMAMAMAIERGNKRKIRGEVLIWCALFGIFENCDWWGEGAMSHVGLRVEI